jgi:hypothetical protein
MLPSNALEGGATNKMNYIFFQIFLLKRRLRKFVIIFLLLVFVPIGVSAFEAFCLLLRSVRIFRTRGGGSD